MKKTPEEIKERTRERIPKDPKTWPTVDYEGEY